MRLHNIVSKMKKIPLRNFRDINGRLFFGKQIICEQWINPVHNLGDEIVEPIIQFMFDKKEINFSKIKKREWYCRPKHLLTVGSAIGLGLFDAVVWGTGIHKIGNISSLIKFSKFRKYDVRAVRGPITRWFLTEAGYSCPPVYGDPAILMPYVYRPILDKKYECSLICHFDRSDRMINNNSIHFIDIRTDDYKKVIDEIVQSNKVISSSLHGIILAEAYGTPVVFWNDGMYDEIIKYYDWYYSTNRMAFDMALTLDEALKMIPSALPALDEMRDALISAFPVDIWHS